MKTDRVTTLAFDIETVGIVPEDHRDAIERMAEKRDQDAETFCALHPTLTQVVAVGVLDVDEDRWAVFYREDLFPDAGLVKHGHLRPSPDEPHMLRSVGATLDKYRRLITFNGGGFDIPVLIHGLKGHGEKVPRILTRCAAQKPWESEPHIDMMNELRFGIHGPRYSLESYAIGFGLENPKAGGDGSGVGDLVREGTPEALAELCDYVMGDVRTTAEIWQRWHAGGVGSTGENR